MSDILHPGFEPHPLAESSDGEPFRITDEGKAAWAADKVLSARERLERIKVACQAMISEAARDVESAEAFFLPLLEEWARANPPRKGKTIKLPTGALSFRAVPGGPLVYDEGACLDWAINELPDAVKTVKSLSKSAIKDYVKQTGDLPPGVELVDGRETFDVKGA